MNEPRSASSFPEREYERVARNDARYPSELLDLQENAPDAFWIEGSMATLSARPLVAIVGTRRSTAYGERVTRELSTAFARAGACIVSGLAAGIDGTAHRAALECGGATVAVLGTGLAHVFPKAHRSLQRTIAERGLLISEIPPEYAGQKWTFPHRNRIIAALSTLTIVVEAGEGSGALNTADHALGLDRLLAAVPGNIDQPQCAGSNRLIRDGAHLIASVADALALVGLTPPPRGPRADASGDEAVVWGALANGALDIDSLCQRTALPAAKCLAAVTKLEIAGSIECALTGEIRRR